MKKFKAVKTRFNERTWLNDSSSPSTGAVVVYDGPATYANSSGKFDRIQFVEVADCHQSIRLHRTQFDTEKDFRKKIKRLKNALKRYLKQTKK